MISSNLHAVRSRARRIVHRTSGQTHGPITRLMSPGDLGELVKPFVFLDYFEMESAGGPGMADHPHSGLATHTTLLDGGFAYRDSTGKSGILERGSVEWMQAGGGVWHGGDPSPGARIRGYQLWVALPPHLELAPAESHYLAPSAVPGDGRVRVLLGQYEEMRSALPHVSPLTYLHVRLHDGETWRYQPPAGHDVAWLAANEGRLHPLGSEAVAGVRKQMVVFEDGGEGIDMRAEGETELVIGSAVRHPHDLVCGYYSVHTSDDALVRGESGYRRIAPEYRRIAPGLRERARAQPSTG
jgi:redox-sensitive bicupin YhaK (pirin superfamily)